MRDNATGTLKLAFWAPGEPEDNHGLTLALSRSLDAGRTECEVKLVVNLVRTEAYWRLEPTDPWEWVQPGSMYPGHGLDGRDAGYTASEMAWHKYAFTTLHPGCLLGVAHAARRCCLTTSASSTTKCLHRDLLAARGEKGQTRLIRMRSLGSL
jgi:hypothetical protein